MKEIKMYENEKKQIVQGVIVGSIKKNIFIMY